VDERKCLGFVLDPGQKLYAYTIPEAHPPVEIERNFRSLEHLICGQFQSANKPKSFPTNLCLSLAIDLAYSLLQLHATAWLTESWCKKSILFPVNEKQPYVTLAITGRPSTESSFGIERQSILNPYLVALGIVLLELSEGKLLEVWLKDRSDITFDGTNVLDRANAARTWLMEDAKTTNKIEAYAKVITRCLDCSFNPPVQIKTLTNASFREAVYRDIVFQLERMYEKSMYPLGK